MAAQKLSDVDFLILGTTGVYAGLKKDIAHVCADVTRAGCIDEICIADIITTFKLHGYEIVRREGNTTSNSLPLLTATSKEGLG